MPSEREMAPRYTLLTLSTLVITVYTVYTIQTALHCLNSSMYVYIIYIVHSIYVVYILFGKVTTLLENAHGLLSKKWEQTGSSGVEWIPLRLL